MEKEEIIQITKNKMAEIKALLPDYRGIALVIGGDCGVASAAEYKNDEDIMPVFLQLAAAFAQEFAKSPLDGSTPVETMGEEKQHLLTYIFLSTAMHAMERKYNIDPMPTFVAKILFDKRHAPKRE